MITIPEAARRLGRNPETIRRWSREGKLVSREVGTQHTIDEGDLKAVLEGTQLPPPETWAQMLDGRPTPNANVVRARARWSRDTDGR
jgi:excisionase family DNA binding protein